MSHPQAQQRALCLKKRSFRKLRNSRKQLGKREQRRRSDWLRSKRKTE
jgi:hypothetical protein